MIEPEPTLDRRLGRWLGSQFLSRGMEQSIAEAFAIATILSFGVYFSTAGETPSMYLQALVIGPLSAIHCALRMRLSPSGLSRNLHLEASTAAILTVLVTTIAAVLSVPAVMTQTASAHISFAIFLGFWNLGAFIVFRLLAYFWPFWVRLRRSRLRWEMTHSTLLVVAPISATIMLLFVVFVVAFGGFNFLGVGLSPLERAVGVLPLIGILIFFTVVGLAVLLPPAALISYFAARNTAARLEALSRGTSGLREGNLAIRVRVDGEDEVSEVQRDFNAMAGTLERTIEDLREERDRVERLLTTQRELVASVSHELRTPVATMRGYLESALDGGSERVDGELRGDLEIMSREVVRLQRLIDDLFILSRAEAGRLPLDIKPTNVTDLVSRCVATVAPNAWRTGRVEVIEEVEPGLPEALADAGRLEQAVRNLLSNAVRHTPPGGIVALSTRSTDASVFIEVRDTGEGIAAESLDEIFNRFHRLDTARQRDPAGAGLGLALVKELTEAMGGCVLAESEPGVGSTFTIQLPRA